MVKINDKEYFRFLWDVYDISKEFIENRYNNSIYLIEQEIEVKNHG